MKLQNHVSAKRNTNVNVLGTIYHIGPGGYIVDDKGEPMDVPEEHASRLLQGRAWSELSWDPNDPANARRFKMPTPPSRAALGRPVRTREDMAVEYGAKPKKADELAPNVVEKADKDGNVVQVQQLDPRAPEGQDLEALAKADAEQEQQSRQLVKGEDPETGIEYASSVPEVDQDQVITQPVRMPVQEDPAAADTAELYVGKDGTHYTVPADGDWPDPASTMPKAYLQAMAEAYEVEFKPRTPVSTLVKRINAAMYPEV